MKAKRLLFVLLILTVFLFTSCIIDSMQSVSYKNGQYVITYRLTMPKDLISTLVSLSDSDSSSFADTEDFYDFADAFAKLFSEAVNSKSSNLNKSINDLYEDLKESIIFPDNGSASKINTDTDVGILYETTVYADSVNDKDYSAYIPKRYQNALTLKLSKNLINPSDNELDELDELDDFNVFFSGIKHRIYIAKNILPTLSKAEITNSDYIGRPLTFYDAGEMWCIELPFSFLWKENSSSYKYIVMYF